MFVALGIQREIHMHRTVICGLPSYTNILQRYFLNGTICDQIKLLTTKRVFPLSVQLLSETFLIRWRNERDMINACFLYLFLEASWNVTAHAQKPDFVFQRNRRVHLNQRWASVQSTTGRRGVRISGSTAGYTLFRDSVNSAGYPLHSPVSPFTSAPCVTVCHHILTGVYYPVCLSASIRAASLYIETTALQLQTYPLH